MKKLFTTLAAVAATVTAVPAMAQTFNECVVTEAAQVEYVIIDEDAYASYQSLAAADLADNGRYDLGNEAYMAQFESFEAVNELPKQTFVMRSWFRMHHAASGQPIKLFVLQQPLVSPDGTVTNTVTTEAMVGLPALSEVQSARDVPHFFASSVCDLRRKLGKLEAAA